MTVAYPSAAVSRPRTAAPPAPRTRRVQPPAARVHAAIRRAHLVHPEPVATVLVEHLHAWLAFGHRFERGSSLVGLVCDGILRVPLPAVHSRRVG